MLVLSRNVGEEIVIMDDIVVTVLRISGGRVRLGIVAPDDVPVDRREVYESKKQDGLRRTAARR